jgi:hypothetical protein
MLIWRPYTDPSSPFAWAAELPSPYSRHITCPQCSAVLGHEERPLRIYWCAGSDVIGDVVFVPSADRLVVTEPLMRFLVSFGGLAAYPVELEDNPTEKATRRRPKVQLPYTGPELFEVRANRQVHFDRGRTHSGPIRRPCGHDGWQFGGWSRIETTWDADSGTLTTVVVPREPGGGIYVREGDLKGDGFFSLIESRGLPLYLTDKVRDAFLGTDFTNLDFLEAGEAVADA